nr:integumentary mucin C.1-like [Crassostrea gigas]
MLFSSVTKLCDRADVVNPSSTSAPTTKQPTAIKLTTTISMKTTPKPTTSTTTTTTKQTTTTPKPPPTTTTKPTTAVPATGRPTSAPGISCTNNEGKLYPYSNDCTKYIQCVHGSPLVRPCNPGLHFSPTSLTFTWSNLAGCQ